MIRARRPASLVVFFICVTTIFILLSAQRVNAVGSEANPQCMPWFPTCGCNLVPCKKGCCPGANTNGCPVGICTDSTSGFTVKGICAAAGQCKGVTASGMGGDLGALQQALGITKQIMDLLKGGGGGGGGGGGDTGALGGCVSGYYNVSTPSSDPCAIYTGDNVSNTLLNSGSSGTSGISDALLDALDGGSSQSVGDLLNAQKPPTPTSGTGTPALPGTPRAPITPTTSGQLTGTIQVGEAGATIIANLREGVSEVAGFFGGSTFGGTSGQSIAGRLCASRPWASGGLLARFIPDSFFDSLCSKAGYQVGVVTPQTAATPVIIPKKTQPVQATTTRIVPDLGPISADIWAEPASVRLGTRTYIFWRSLGASNCTVSGPNFTQNSLSGGASTVPLSGATTYTLECTAPNGSRATDTVTVNIAI